MPDTEDQQAQELYDKLKPEAVTVYVDHILSRTPPALQEEMKVIAAADMTPDAPEPDPTVASVSNGASVVVNDSTGAAQPGSPGTAAVADGALTAITLGPIAQRAGQSQGQQDNIRRGTIPPRR